MRATATHLDGTTGAAREVELWLDAEAGAITGAGLHWPLDEIRALPDIAGGDLLILHLRGDPLQRLILRDRAWLAHLPHAHRRAPVANRKRLAGMAVAAILSVLLIVFVLVPTMADQLAAYIPPEGEQALGEVTLTQIREAMDETGVSPIGFCTESQGRAALDKMAARLTDGAQLHTRIDLHVLDHPLVNAFALPGGQVVLFRGLIEAAETPEEVAAVLAHEIGHVVSRDPTRNALRSAGSIGVLGLLFGDFAGGAVVLFLTERLIEAQYSQKAEAAADRYAIDLMRGAGLPPGALADMFERFRKLGSEAEGFVAHFQAHPKLGDRIAAARAAGVGADRGAPLLSARDWHALQAICGGGARPQPSASATTSQ